MSKIVVIGSSNTDLVVKTPRMPEPGETILGGTFMMAGGGKGANQAVAVARLGGEVTFIAKVGNDLFGTEAVARYAEEGIDSRTILRDDAAPTGVALITVDSSGENCIVVAPGANDTLSCEDIDANRATIAAAEYLLMQLEIPLRVVEHAATLANVAGVKVILNPAPASALPDKLIASLYMITPNKTECRILTGVDIAGWEDAERAARILADKGVRRVVITLGSMGALTFDGTACERIPAERIAAVDTTAAGDTFNGAMCVALSEGRSLSDAARFATRAAAISVTRLGAQTSIPRREELG